MPDPEFESVRRPFDAAFHRMCSATTVGDLEDELSNALHHLYRLAELCKTRFGVDSQAFYHGSTAVLRRSQDLRAARAIAWARAFDTHETVVVASHSDIYSNFYTEMYGSLVWKPLAQLPVQTDKHDRHIDYQSELQGRPVLDSIRRAFDALAALLQNSTA